MLKTRENKYLLTNTALAVGTTSFRTTQKHDILQV